MERLGHTLFALVLTLSALCLAPGARAQEAHCTAVMSLDALCSCLRASGGESAEGTCEITELANQNFATMRTPEGAVSAIARKGDGYYELTQLHGVGMEAFAVRSARIRPLGDGAVLRIVTVRQEGSEGWIHTTNEVVLCPLTSPRAPGVACVRYPLYAHTRVLELDAPSEQETRFRVELRDDGAAVVNVRGGALQHPELEPALGAHTLRRES